MEERILYNVLRLVGTGKENVAAPDKEYIESLKKIGMIKSGWDNQLTELGKGVLSYLSNKIEKWV